MKREPYTMGDALKKLEKDAAELREKLAEVDAAIEEYRNVPLEDVDMRW
jgi:molecular chaperone GrpE (heat shock protein)